MCKNHYNYIVVSISGHVVVNLFTLSIVSTIIQLPGTHSECCAFESCYRYIISYIWNIKVEFNSHTMYQKLCSKNDVVAMPTCVCSFISKPRACDGTNGLVATTAKMSDSSIGVSYKGSIIKWQLTHRTHSVWRRNSNNNATLKHKAEHTHFISLMTTGPPCNCIKLYLVCMCHDSWLIIVRLVLIYLKVLSSGQPILDSAQPVCCGSAANAAQEELLDCSNVPLRG